MTGDCTGVPRNSHGVKSSFPRYSVLRSPMVCVMSWISCAWSRGPTGAAPRMRTVDTISMAISAIVASGRHDRPIQGTRSRAGRTGSRSTIGRMASSIRSGARIVSVLAAKYADWVWSLHTHTAMARTGARTSIQYRRRSAQTAPATTTAPIMIAPRPTHSERTPTIRKSLVFQTPNVSQNGNGPTRLPMLSSGMPSQLAKR
ncbi:unannotated protein [freshwater metagenome]|uniref:Unannotated protein n=1 Tax=freshwater metagenome TaxID=449393 RepID=A0A6J7LKM4_9ZZZZ